MKFYCFGNCVKMFDFETNARNKSKITLVIGYTILSIR